MRRYIVRGKYSDFTPVIDKNETYLTPVIDINENNFSQTMIMIEYIVEGLDGKLSGVSVDT